LIAIVSGFFVSVVTGIMAFRNDAMTSGLVFGAIAIGCALLCYRTFVSRDELRSNFK
jgi:CHASE2 domain-containing sensor protein